MGFPTPSDNAASGLPFQQTIAVGTGVKTTTGALAAIDTVNLPWQTFTDLKLGETVEFCLDAQIYAAAVGDEGNMIIDVEVDPPVGANTFVGATNPAGFAIINYLITRRQQFSFVIKYVVPTSGQYAFRPAWRSLDGTANKQMQNAATATADGTPIVFTSTRIGTAT